MKTLFVILLLSPAVLGSSEPQREAFLFETADRNHDGSLTEGDLHQIFLDFDNNHDQDITLDEFINDWTTVFSLGNSHEATLLFNRADVDQDGMLTSTDLPAIFAYFDMNGDNLVDRNEFLTQWADLRLNAPDQVTFQVDSSTSPSA